MRTQLGFQISSKGDVEEDGVMPSEKGDRREVEAEKKIMNLI